MGILEIGEKLQFQNNCPFIYSDMFEKHYKWNKAISLYTLYIVLNITIFTGKYDSGSIGMCIFKRLQLPRKYREANGRFETDGNLEKLIVNYQGQCKYEYGLFG